MCFANYSFSRLKVNMPQSLKNFKMVALQRANSKEEKMIKNCKKPKTLMADCKWFPVCPMKYFYEQGELDRKWILDFNQAY